MKIDVLIEYDKKLSEVTFSSKATQFSQTRPARIGLSHPKFEKCDYEMIEFVGEDWEDIKKIPDLFQEDENRKNWILRIVNPFESSTFEPYALLQTINFFSIKILAEFYPKTWTWRRMMPFFIKYEIALKIPDYRLFEPTKKMEFEKLLYEKFRKVSFIF